MPSPPTQFSRVLLICTNTTWREQIQTQLIRLGYKVTASDNLKQGCKAFAKHSILLTNQLEEKKLYLHSWLQENTTSAPWIGFLVEKNQTISQQQVDQVNWILRDCFSKKELKTILNSAQTWLAQQANTPQSSLNQTTKQLVEPAQTTSLTLENPLESNTQAIVNAPSIHTMAVTVKKTPPTIPSSASSQSTQEENSPPFSVSSASSPRLSVFQPQPSQEVPSTVSTAAESATTQLLLQHSPTPLAIFDSNLRLLNATNSFFALFQLSPQTSIGYSFSELFYQQGNTWEYAAKQALLGHSQKGNKACIATKKDRPDWINWEMRPWNEDDTKKGIILICEVVTLTVQREEQKRIPFELGASLLEEELLSIFAIDLEGRVQKSNVGAQQFSTQPSIDSCPLFTEIIALEEPAAWLESYRLAVAELRQSGRFIFPRQFDWKLRSGEKVSGIHIPWVDDREYVQGVLLLFWPQQANQQPHLGVYPSLELLPSMLTWPMALYSADGCERQTNESWKKLPQQLQIQWPKPNPETLQEFAIGEHPGAIMIPLGQEKVEQWLAIAPPANAGSHALNLLQQVQSTQQELAQTKETITQAQNKEAKLHQTLEINALQQQKELEDRDLLIAQARAYANEIKQEQEQEQENLNKKIQTLETDLKRVQLSQLEKEEQLSSTTQLHEQQGLALEKVQQKYTQLQETTLQQHEKLTTLEHALDSITEVCFLLNSEGKVEDCNSQVEHIFGSKPEKGQPFTLWAQEVMLESDASLQQAQALLHPKKSDVFKTRDHQGVIREMNFVRQETSQQNSDVFFLLGQDVSKFHQNQRQLHLLQSRYQAILKISHIRMAVVSSHRGVVEVSENLAELLQLDPEEILGNTLEQFVIPDQRKSVQEMMSSSKELTGTQERYIVLSCKETHNKTYGAAACLRMMTLSHQEEGGGETLQLCLFDPVSSNEKEILTLPKVHRSDLSLEELPLMIAMLELQARKTADFETQQVLYAHARRLNSLKALGEQQAEHDSSDLNLTKALQDLATRTQEEPDTAIQIQIQLQPDVYLDKLRTRKLILATQELLFNSVQVQTAQQPANVELILAKDAQTIYLDILSSGTGFSAKDESSLSLGLARCLLDDANIQIELRQTQQQGLRAHIAIPLVQDKPIFTVGRT